MSPNLNLFEKIELVCVPVSFVFFAISFLTNSWNCKTLLGSVFVGIGSVSMSIAIALFMMYVAWYVDGGSAT
jgi:cobalamin biosynthesis protein CobD/CbiB